MYPYQLDLPIALTSYQCQTTCIPLPENPLNRLHCALHIILSGEDSGCNKLDSGKVELHPNHWYHVALHLGTHILSIQILSMHILLNHTLSIAKLSVRSSQCAFTECIL
jgi:hypothetical protein